MQRYLFLHYIELQTSSHLEKSVALYQFYFLTEKFDKLLIMFRFCYVTVAFLFSVGKENRGL